MTAAALATAGAPPLPLRWRGRRAALLQPPLQPPLPAPARARLAPPAPSAVRGTSRLPAAPAAPRAPLGAATAPFGATALFVALLMGVLIFWPLDSAPGAVAAELLSRALYAAMLWAGLRAMASAWRDGRGVWTAPAPPAAGAASPRSTRARR